MSRGLTGFYLSSNGRRRPRARAGGSGHHSTLGGLRGIGLALTDQIFSDDDTLFYDFLDHNGRLGDPIREEKWQDVLVPIAVRLRQISSR